MHYGLSSPDRLPSSSRNRNGGVAMVLPSVIFLDPLNCLKLLHSPAAERFSSSVILSMLSTVSTLKLLACCASSKRNDRGPSILGELGYAILFAGCAIELHLEVALVVSVLTKFTLGILQNRAPLPLLAVREGIDFCSPRVQNHGVKGFDVHGHGCRKP